MFSHRKKTAVLIRNNKTHWWINCILRWSAESRDRLAQKKITVKPLEQRRQMIESNPDICLCRQSDLLCIHRSGLYYKPVPETKENLNLMRIMDEQYFKTPFYGIYGAHCVVKPAGISCQPQMYKAAHGTHGVANHLS